MKKVKIIIFLCFGLLNAKSQIITGDSTSANIYYKNLHDTGIGCPGGQNCNVSKIFDVNLDGVNDLKFAHNFASAMGYLQYEETVSSLNPNIQFIIIPTDTLLLDTIQKGTLINRSKNWKYDPTNHFLHYYYWSGGNTTDTGVFDNTNRYIGFRIIEPTDTLYGWFRIRLQNQGTAYIGITFLSYAVNTPLNSIWEINNENSIRIYPNPVSSLESSGSSGQINIQSPIELGKIIVYNCVGESIAQTNSKSQTEHFDISEWKDGIYFIKIETKSGVVTKKIVVQR